MKRRTFAAAVNDGAGVIAESRTFALNSGVRATEALVREIARESGEVFTGGKPGRDVSGVYTRFWTGEKTGRVLGATVTEVLS